MNDTAKKEALRERRRGLVARYLTRCADENMRVTREDVEDLGVPPDEVTELLCEGGFASLRMAQRALDTALDAFENAFGESERRPADGRKALEEKPDTTKAAAGRRNGKACGADQGAGRPA